MSELFVVASEVQAALADGRPVVALETTVVTHGFPAPHGRRTAAEMEDEVRAGGAIPATVGILDGCLRVGLTGAELDDLAGGAAEKLTLGNLAAGLAGRRPGSTTVAATTFAAHRAGIRVFATGGIGGVHRGFTDSGDVSADLTALSRYAVAVVCAGAKAVLDVPRTLEALETLGVPVYGLGTDRFPAFYRRDSGAPVDVSFESVEEVASAVRAHFELGTGTGVVVANPVPVAAEMGRELYEEALTGALADAARQSLRGRAVTPFLLERIRERTHGESVRTNRALLIDNARVAAALAKALVVRPR